MKQHPMRSGPALVLAYVFGFSALGCGSADEPAGASTATEAAGTQVEALSATLAPSLDLYVRDARQ
jgi:hypothetical protein